jgi:hypothetical protein
MSQPIMSPGNRAIWKQDVRISLYRNLEVAAADDDKTSSSPGNDNLKDFLTAAAAWKGFGANGKIVLCCCSASLAVFPNFSECNQLQRWLLTNSTHGENLLATSTYFSLLLEDTELFI